MKKIISMILIAAMMVSLSVTIFAESSSSEDYQYQDTEKYVAIALRGETGEAVVAVSFRDTPQTVYQWIGETNASLENLLTETALMEMLGWEGTQIFYTGTAAEPYNLYEENAVKNDVTSRHTTPRRWYKDYEDSTTYSPLKIIIRADDFVDVEKMGTQELEKGMTVAAAAVTIATAAGIEVSAAIRALVDLFSLYSAESVFLENHRINTYRGIFLTQRTGTVTPQGGKETPMITATRTWVGYYFFNPDCTSSDAADAMVYTGENDIIYGNSEYEYRISTMVKNTYKEYVQ